MELRNDTPFELDRFVLFDRDAAEVLVVVLKGSFDLHHGEPARRAEEQDPICPVDVHRGEPDDSSLITAGEMSLPAPATSVVISAHAVAPAPGTREMFVRARVGDLSQSAVVRGGRRWLTLAGPQPSAPEVFERIPLLWENAFGGRDLTADKASSHVAQSDNPVGKGLVARGSQRRLEDVELPNIEHPDRALRDPYQRPPPVGFGPVAPYWQPRIGYAGTYDDAWRADRAPLVAEDFDDRFFLIAAQGLVASGHLQGGEPCFLEGMTAEQALGFALPAIQPSVQARYYHGGKRVPCVLDTVLIDADARRLNLIWKGCAVVHGRLETIEAIQAKVAGDV